MQKDRYPQEEKLIGYLKSLDEIEPRDPEAAERGKAQFMKLAEFYGKPVSQRKESRLNQWIGSIQFFGRLKERKPMLVTISSVLVALALVLGGGGVTAYAAQESLPDEALYPLKLQIEDWQLEINEDPVKEVALMTKFANQRVDEMVDLANRGDAVPAQLMFQLETQLKTMMGVVAEMDPESMVIACDQIRQTLQTRDRIQGMTGMPEGLEPAMHMLQWSHRLAQVGVEEPWEFQNQFRFQQDGNAGPPAEDDGPPYGNQDGSCEDPGSCEPIGDENKYGPQGPNEEAGPPDESEDPPHGNQNGDCDQTGDCQQDGSGQGEPQPGNGQGEPQPDNGQGEPQPDNGQGEPQPDNGQGTQQPGTGGGGQGGSQGKSGGK